MTQLSGRPSWCRNELQLQLEQRLRLGDRPPHVLEDLHRHQAVEPRPAGQERPGDLDRHVAVAHPQRCERGREPFLHHRSRRRLVSRALPQLGEHLHERLPETGAGMRVVDAAVLERDQARQRGCRRSARTRLGGVTDHSRNARAIASIWWTWSLAGVVAGGDDDVAQLVVEVAGDRHDQRVEAGEVAVDGRGGHAHVAGDGAQRDAPRSARRRAGAGRLLDLGDRRGAQPFPPAWAWWSSCRELP